ncbi:DUF7146 domain-containing protein [Roseospira goensis]|uniref:Toprim domain-containing protein n=1 Tax=Roseospira goensis TaxID=391922 RepID=A0A7W6S2L1_9PROT|nr:toprim domain-containing protein [Roseospira goensis]MBB4287245.1 hypothetical protein [Roseospira goensis]
MSLPEIVSRLAAEAEAVCRTYLPAGRRQGAYWQVGDVLGTPGGSLYVRLTGPRAGKWTDAATSQHGDLLDLIAANRGLDLRAALDEATAFLRLPHDPPAPAREPVPANSTAVAQRLFAASRPIAGTLAARYLAGRGIVLAHPEPALRFHPRAFCRPDPGMTRTQWPALIAAVTAADGTLTGVHRTFLDPATSGKAPLIRPRRALGLLLGNGVWFGAARPVLVVGEGLETILSLRSVLPDLPAVAALSAAHLGAFKPPPGLRRLYVAHDADAPGLHALARLAGRLGPRPITVRPLPPVGADANADLLSLGPRRFRARVLGHLDPADVPLALGRE